MNYKLSLTFMLLASSFVQAGQQADWKTNVYDTVKIISSFSHAFITVPTASVAFLALQGAFNEGSSTQEKTALGLLGLSLTAISYGSFRTAHNLSDSLSTDKRKSLAHGAKNSGLVLGAIPVAIAAGYTFDTNLTMSGKMPTLSDMIQK